MGTSADPDEPAVRLLGPVEVDGGADGVTLAPRERALLARLALDAGRTVTVDRLVDDVWGDAPPPSARNALQVYVSHLRARIGTRAIVSMGGGYRVELPAERVDSLVFERLVAVAMGQRSAGRPHEAIASLDAASALWRGEPLADLADYPFARVEAGRLGELRATSLEHLAEALLDAGQLDRLADEMAHRVREHPFRERLRAAVMTGLYRQGRAVDALALYAEVVDRLREELGLEPGPTLKALQRAILTDEPSLAAPADTLPRGELTLLASVLATPAALEDRLGDRYGETVLAHRDLVRATCAAHHGLTVPTDGERLLAAFPGPVDALRAAAAVHRALAEDDVVGAPELRVRIGVHTGTPRVVDQHYVGADVQRVVQVALAAAGGQTLATASAAALLDEQTIDASGWHVVDLGPHRLPELAIPEHLHQVSSGAEEPFVPPRSLGGPSSLPRTGVALVGRDGALAGLVAEAARPGSHLTTLLGPGGAGKTRLAVEVARATGATMPGDVYFVALEAARTAADVWTAMSAALGLPPGGASAPAVLGRLGTGPALLVLDNLEQLGDIAPVIEELLGAGDDVRLLATSRRPTGVAGERLHHVEPLTDGAGGDDASRLFVTCAQLARSDFVLDDGNRDAVARICRRVDGLPLGIELAAARVRWLSPQALASALDDGLDLVAGGPSRPERQRDLHALVAWSVDLLAPHQQRLLELLGVFTGGVDLETVARFPVPDGAPDPVATVLELADASLVRLSDEERPRVSLLETIRDHVTSRLALSGRDREARDAHLAIHLELARRLHPRTAGRARVAEAVHRERRNLESALDHALSSGPEGAEAAAEIIVCIGETWHQLGDGAFGYIQRVAEALPAGSPHHAWMTYWSYRCLWDSEDDLPLILTALAAAEAELRAADDRAPLAALLGYGTDLGRDAGLGDDWGVERVREAAVLARDVGEDWLLATILGSLSRTLVEAGNLDEAHPPLVEARAAAARAGDVHRLDVLTLTESQLVAALGRTDEAWALGIEAAPGLVTMRSDGALAFTCRQLARLAAATGRDAAAAHFLGVALAGWRRMDSVVSAIDLDHLHRELRDTITALGEAEFDRLVDEARGWSADDAVAWVLDLLAADAR